MLPVLFVIRCHNACMLLFLNSSLFGKHRKDSDWRFCQVEKRNKNVKDSYRLILTSLLAKGAKSSTIPYIPSAYSFFTNQNSGCTALQVGQIIPLAEEFF